MKIINTRDFHLDPVKTPICRTDDYLKTQIRKINFVKEQVKKYDAIWVDSGDLSDVGVGNSPSEAIIRANFFNEHLSHLYGVLGNHDQYGKNIALWEKCILSSPIKQGHITHLNSPEYGPVVIDDVVLHGFNYGQDIEHRSEEYDGMVNIAVYHGYVSKSADVHVSGLLSRDLLKEFYQDYDFILCGDNHTPFIDSYKGCTLINGGSILRTTIKQKDYKPHIHLIDTDTKEVVAIPVPIEDRVISTEHAEEIKEREDRIDSFIMYLDNDYEVTKSFEDNMVGYLKANSVFVIDGEEREINSNVKRFINGCTAKEEYRYS